MKNVLIITYSFPPLNNIASRRFGELVPYLTQYGWEPTILTTNSNGSLPIGIKEQNIIRYGQHPQNSVKVSDKTTNGFKSNFLNFKRDSGFNLRMFDRTYYNWYKKIISEKEIFKNKKFDLVLSSFGPGASLFIGNYYSKEFGVPWIADFRDLGALYIDRSFKQNFLAKFIDKKIETKLLKNANALISIGNTLSKILSEQYDRPSYTIFNGWEKHNNDNKLNYQYNYIYYAGRFYSHQMESIFKVVHTLKSFRNIKFIIRSLGPEKYNLELLDYAKEKGVENQIKLLEPSSPDTVIKESQAALANLVVEDLDKSIGWKKGTLTGKFLGLLPFTPPIVAVAREDSEIGIILKETNKGMLCSTENDIRNFLNSLEDNYYSGNSNIEFYSKKNQAKVLAEVFDKTLKD